MRDFYAYQLTIGGMPRRRLGPFSAHPESAETYAYDAYRRSGLRVVEAGSSEAAVLDRQLGMSRRQLQRSE